MYIEQLGRHLYVCSLSETADLLKRDRGFWNIVSIHEPEIPRACFREAKKIHYGCFHDVEDIAQAPGCRSPQPDHLEAILRFVDSIPGEPIMIHCRAGLSRSPAVALTLIVRAMVKATAPDQLVNEAADVLLAIRPQARPNVLVLRLGLEQFLPAPIAEDLAKQLVNHPQMLENRFIRHL